MAKADISELSVNQMYFNYNLHSFLKTRLTPLDNKGNKVKHIPTLSKILN